MPSTFNSTGSGGNWNADATWAEAGQPGSADNVIITAGDTVTLTANAECAYLVQNGSSGNESTLALASYTLIINSFSGGRAVDVGNSYCNLADNTGTLKFTGGTTATYDLQGIQHWSDEIQNVEIDASANTPTYEMQAAMTVNGNLTITDGILDTDSSNNYALTVTGNTSGAGTLQLNNSTYTGGGAGSHMEMSGATITIGTSGVITNVDQLGSGDASSAITCTGSPTLGCRRFRCRVAGWTPATSTLKIEAGSSDINYNNYTLHNLEIASTGKPRMQGTITVGGILTLSGSGGMNTASKALTVTGTTYLGSGAELDCYGSTITCGSNVSGPGTINFMSSTFTANDNLGAVALNVGTATIDVADQFGSVSDHGGHTIIAEAGGIVTFDTVSVNGGTAWDDGTYYVTDGTSSVTGANGTLAEVKIVISSGAATVTIVYGGKDYQVDSSWSVPDALLGNNGGNALTFDVATIKSATISCLRFHAVACTPSTMTVTLDGATHASAIGIASGTLSIHHLIVNASGATKTLFSPLTCAGNLTVTAGTLDTGADKALTVAGDTEIASGGTLTGNNSVFSFGNGVYSAQEQGALWVKSGGMFTFGSGDITTSSITCHSGSVTTPNLISTGGGDIIINGRNDNGMFMSHNNHGINITGDVKILNNHTGNIDLRGNCDVTCANFIIDDTGTGQTVGFYATDADHYLSFNIIGNLLLTDATMITCEHNGSGYHGDINVSGDLVIGAGGLLNAPRTDLSRWGNLTAGSLVIESGGTYNASPGTNTITGGFRPADVVGTLTLNGGAWVLGGTGGLFEGDFLKTEREVRINQDKVLNFDGASDKIDLNYGNGFDPDNGMTISCWVNMDDEVDTSDEIFLGANNGSNQRLYMTVYNNDFSFGYGSEAWTDGGRDDVIAGKWFHILLTMTGGDQKLYVNGVVTQTKSVATHAGLASDIYVAQQGTSVTYGFDGKISDVRIYDSVLGAADIAKLSSKMFVGVGAPVGWWKLNEETATGGGAGTGFIQDSGSGGNEGIITGTSWTYNDFSVDIQDNTTTVGNLIVESGKLNTKALVSRSFDGTNDYAESATEGTSALNMDDNSTISLWFKRAAFSGDTEVLLGKPGASSGQNGQWLIELNSEGRLTFHSWQTITDIIFSTAGLDDGNWHHIVIAWDIGGENEVYSYVDGILDNTESATSNTTNTGNIAFGSCADVAGSWCGSKTFFEGELRDVRIWAYRTLSVDQVASLYRGSYNATPDGWWKMDESSGNLVNSGIETIPDATSANMPSVNDGTLKVNGAARVMTNGSVL